MDFMFLSNSRIHMLSFVFQVDYQLDILSTCFVFVFVKCNILWYIDDDGHVNMEKFPLMIRYFCDARSSSVADQF